ncbi:hypothetical protein ABZX85_15290 [Streptomyces sp. NPDC004539]|uniref:hypothetical protein n=1 Tax=Streptomyces sp. NPDC004539 TaxID=3154280 RepID=UPI0033A299D1
MSLLTPAEPQAPEPVAQPVTADLATTVADMRAVARWTLTATAAVGGLLLAGFPLAAVGKIHGRDDLFLAMGGLGLGVTGVSWAIWWTGEVLTPRFTTLRALEDRALGDLRTAIAAEPEAFFGPFGTTAAALDAACRTHATVAVRLTELLARTGDEQQRVSLAASVAAAHANLARATARRRHLVELIHAWQVRAALRRARVQTLVGSLLVVVGAVLFLFATGGK